MKRTFLIVLFCLIITEGVFSVEDSTIDKKDFIKPYFSVSNESEFNVKHDSTDDLAYFNAYNNKINSEAGIKFEIRNYVKITPFTGLSDLKWEVNNSGSFTFLESSVYAGSAFTFKPLDFFSIGTWLSNVEKFETSSVIWAGFKTGLACDFNIEKAFLELSLSDEISPVFKTGIDPKTTTSLVNMLEYSLGFNFLNFVNEKINTGLYIEGKFETASLYRNQYDSTSLTNEFFAGIKTNPIKYFEGFVGIAMFNEAGYGNNFQIESGSKILDIGLKASLVFSYEWFSFDLSYVPRLYTSVDNIQGKINHFFTVNMTLSLGEK
jgi:hypothetical protein